MIGSLQMASLSLCPRFETNLTSNRKVIEVFLQLKIPKAHGKNYIKVVPLLVRHLLRDGLFCSCCLDLLQGDVCWMMN